MMDRLTVMGCLEGLTQDDWQQWYSDSEVQETAKAALALLKEQGKQKFFLDSDGKITPLPNVVRCKDCKYQNEYRTGSCPFYTTWGSVAPDDWFCADGDRGWRPLNEVSNDD